MIGYLGRTAACWIENISIKVLLLGEKSHENVSMSYADGPTPRFGSTRPIKNGSS